LKQHTLFVEKLPPFASESRHLLHDLRASLALPGIASLRVVNRYDITGIDEADFQIASTRVLSEPQVDSISTTLALAENEHAFAHSYLPGQFDQRADSAAQCIQILTGKDKPEVISSRVIILTGELSSAEIASIKSYVINPVDSHEIVAADCIRQAQPSIPADIEILTDFLTDTPEKIRKAMSLAMSEADIAFTQNYFGTEENRPPTLTEIRMLDTYWSDHCRHTTFLTAIDEVTFDPGTEVIGETYDIYRSIREKLGRDDKPVTLMDIALIGMRELKASGELDNLEVSEEINAASIVVPVTRTVDNPHLIHHILSDESLSALPENLARQAREFLQAASHASHGGGAGRGRPQTDGTDLVWAENTGQLILASFFAKHGDPISSYTSEHQVWFDETRIRALKRTWPGVFGQVPVQADDSSALDRENAELPAYLLRMALHIALFGSDLKFEGVSISTEPGLVIGQASGQPSAVISQEWIQAADPSLPLPSLAQIADYMLEKGFHPIAKSFFGWSHPNGIAVIDAKPDNFILSENGVVPIDLQIAPVPARITEEWLIQFKNETHNHPTEIEPFGGAATCLGGCIRDPLSGRSYVYQAMRVTGAGDPLTPFSETLPGKLPQKKICQVAAKGYSSYGNQIGLATGQVAEVYHPGYVAKRLEIGAVVAAAPRSNVFRGSPAPGDVILLIGGRTGRDGVGGATGSSKEHTETALENSAEVQKGDAPTERKIQRLFRNPELTRKIKICNDFGAGGVSVAIGEIAPSLVIHLDAVPKKYDGLDGTELAISESQERMAVCIDRSEIGYFIAEADKENLECVHVADVTDSGRLIMHWCGKEIVNLSRAFLDTNGVQQTAKVHVTDCGLQSATSPTDHRSPITDHLASLNICSQKGLGEMFDSSVGANTVLWPFGGKHQLTPPDAMVAKLPVLEGETDHATYMAWGFDPHLSEKSPFLGAAYAVTESVCKAVAAGARLSDIRLTLQEYFPKLGQEPKRWGLPFAALLGAFRAQHELRLAAIGGKDSMSGSFNDLDVPPTLVSFALAPGLASLALSPEFKKPGSTVSIVETPILANGLPDFDALKQTAVALHNLNKAGRILSLHHIGKAGLAAAITKCCLGNHVGAIFGRPINLFNEAYFTFLIEHTEELTLNEINIGQTTEAETLTLNGETHSLADLQSAWQSTLEPVYPTRPEAGSEIVDRGLMIVDTQLQSSTIRNPQSTISKPKVLIPAFPGTNSEYDSARAFQRVGATTHIEVFRNLSARHIAESIHSLAQKISESQILFIPGGFSAGDEPDGSAKFIATILRNPRVSDAITDLLENRDGLVLGICNGFQALVKTGLVPYGQIVDSGSKIEDSHLQSTIHDPSAQPTLIHNDISRHISQYVHTRIAANSSPWLANMAVGEIHTVPVSHGEGKFFATPETLAALAANGQIATQYCDLSGAPTMEHPFNPNGSLAAIEGITSPCGRVFGKMAHSERFSENVAKNIPGHKAQPIFSAGVNYFS
jgi:phosphoribosylformylglycinamidine synthase